MGMSATGYDVLLLLREGKLVLMQTYVDNASAR